MAEVKHATHSDPVWREQTNYIIQADLEPHGMSAGSYEQLWTRTADHRRFVVCCIPFFTYGIALGDVVVWSDEDRRVQVVERPGRRVVRAAFVDRADAAAAHDVFHGQLVATGALVEFQGVGFASVDIDDDDRLRAVLDVVKPFEVDGRAEWEWGSE